MTIKQPAIAGTLESSDVQVTIEPAEGGVSLDIQSSVLNQYGKQIKAVILQTLTDLQVDSARVMVVDKGALDCTLKARVECAVFRASGETGPVAWGGVVRA